MGSASKTPSPSWASQPCMMGIDEAGRGPVLGPMVYGCLYCALSYKKTLASLNFADSKTLKEEKREELFENLKADDSIGWLVDVIDPRELSAKMLKKTKINLNEISHESALGLVSKVLEMGVLLTEVYVDTVGDAEKYRVKCSERFPGIKFVVAKKADSLYPVVSGASIVAKERVYEIAQNANLPLLDGDPGHPSIPLKYTTVLRLTLEYSGWQLLQIATYGRPKRMGQRLIDCSLSSHPEIEEQVTRDRALRDWVLEETAENMHKNFGSGYPGDPETKTWLDHHKHPIFGFPMLVRFSWGTCTPYFKEITEVLWEADKEDEDGSGSKSGKRQLKLTSLGVTGCKRKVEEMESSAKGRCKFFHARKLEQVRNFN